MHSRALSSKLALLSSASYLIMMTCSPSSAQTLQIPQPPDNSMIDARSIDLTSGQLMFDLTPLTIGTASNGLNHTLYFPGLYGFRHEQMITAQIDDYNQTGIHVTIAFGKEKTGFTWQTSAYVSDKGDGATLTLVGSSPATAYIYTDRNGVVYTLDRTQGSNHNYANTTNYYGAIDAIATVIARPDGYKTRLTYKKGSYVYSGIGTIYPVRLQSVVTSTGYQLKFGYQSNTLSQATASAWQTFGQITAINNAVDYCDPTADTCSGFSQTWPSVSYSSAASGTDTILSITDPSRTSAYRFDSSGRITGFKRPGSGSDTATYGYYTNSSAISSVALASIGTWTYSFSLSGSTLTGSVTTPTIATPFNFTANYNIRQPLTLTNENGHTTTFTYDANGRVQTQTLHGSGSNYSTYGYDARGNLLSVVVTPKSGSGLGTLTTSATYPSSCTNLATCNKPITTTDSNSQVTNYYYNTNGTPDYVQSPRPTGSADRPEIHYSYATAQARVKNSVGAIVDQGDVITLPTGSTTCFTGAWSCATSNQIVTQIAYYGGPSATNLLTQSSTVKLGSGSPSSTTGYAYDTIGNTTSVTDPVGNVSTMSYAADRQPLRAVSPSIDGSGTSVRRGIQYHYNGDGLRDIITYGAYNPTTQALTARSVKTTTYDSQGRKTRDTLTDGSTTYAMTQYSYTGANRLDCSAVRMNSGAFGALADSAACTLGAQGSGSNDFGPDRITRYEYDYAGQLLKAKGAYGVSGQAQDSVTYTYTSHGLQETMLDAKGNLTSFAYDGHDRLFRTCYQGTLSVCQAGTSTDYAQLGYNSAGRLISRSLRGSPGSTIGLTYDNLGRITNVSYPGGGTYDQPVTFTYDNLGRQLSATDGAGHSATFAYDALGNVTSQGDAISSRTMLYDAAGRRTQLTWSDGRNVTYEYNGASDLSVIKEGGTTVVASYGYDDAGRRSSLALGGGAVTTSYNSYTPLGPLQMVLDLAGTANDLTLDFTYNPAGQIATRSRTNDAYAWRGHYNVSRNYTANALNQYTASGSIVPTYDAKGNLTSAGSPVYAYSTKNELTQRTDTGATFYRDPLGRLDTITGSGLTTKLQYDGVSISAELNGGNGLIRRYVHGAGTDEPLVWYEGSDFATRRYLVADERGSVVAVTDASGNLMALNRYDDAGIPAFTNLGRFQYTGQAWLPELGMYDYKARTYSATLGRFLQTDPAGYPDGPNWYAYAMNDPVNGRDPSGLGVLTGCDAWGGNCTDTVTAPSGGGGGWGGSISSGIADAAAAFQAAITNYVNSVVTLQLRQMEGGRQPIKLKPATKKYLCNQLSNNDFNVPGTYGKIFDFRYDEKHPENQQIAVSREAENWLYATGNYRTIPSEGSNKFSVYLYHNLWKRTGLSPTPYSAAAEQAGYNGVDHSGLTQAELSAELRDYCGKN